jgi:hypothetical protein
MYKLVVIADTFFTIRTLKLKLKISMKHEFMN